MSQSKGLLLTSKGEVKNANINLTEDKLTVDDIKKYLRRKENPQQIAEYRNAEITYSLWGYFENTISGKKGNENKSKFPTKSDSFIVRENISPIIGDILLIAYKGDLSNTCSISPTEWNEFVENGTTIHTNDTLTKDEQNTKNKKRDKIFSTKLSKMSKSNKNECINNNMNNDVSTTSTSTSTSTSTNLNTIVNSHALHTIS